MSDHRADAPGYWMFETSGVLEPVVMRYLVEGQLSDSEAATMRAYLRQWIAAPAWRGPEVDELRRTVDGLTTTAEIRRWIDKAETAGCDPL